MQAKTTVSRACFLLSPCSAVHVTWVAYEGQEDRRLLTRVCLSVPACQMTTGDRPSITLTMSLIQEREGTTTMEEQKKERGLELGQAALHHHLILLLFFIFSLVSTVQISIR